MQPVVRHPAYNILERFLWTAVQAFVGSLPATIALTSDSLVAIGYAGLTAAIAAVVSLAKNVTAEATVRQATIRAAAGTTDEVRD